MGISGLIFLETMAAIRPAVRKALPVKALVKSREERGLWLEDVPEPEMGINDVKIRVDRKSVV